MNRRRLLRSLAAGTVLSAGCLGDRGGTAPSPSPANASTASTDTAPGSGSRLSVLGVETFTHAFRLNDLGRSPRGSIPRLDSFGDRERAVLATAIEDGYTTENPPAWLRKLVSETAFVVADGRHYELSHTFPITRITARETTEGAVDGRIADYGTYEEAVTHDGVVASGLMRTARRDGTEFVYVWPSLRAFLGTYDAVRYRGRILDFTVTVEDGDAPDTVTATPASLEDLAGGSVWNASRAAPEARRIVERAGATEGLFAVDDPPKAVLEGLDAHEYVYLNGTFYTTYVEKRRPLPVGMEAAFTDPRLDADPARIELALHNEGDGAIEVFSGAPAPFGVLRFHPEGSPEPNYLLWSDAYETSQHVVTEDHDVTMVQDVGLTTRVDPGGRRSRPFAIERDALPAGTYVLEDSVGVTPADAGGGTFPYRIVFEAT